MIMLSLTEAIWTSSLDYSTDYYGITNVTVRVLRETTPKRIAKGMKLIPVLLICPCRQRLEAQLQ